MLCHATHNEEAKKIRVNAPQYCFKVRQKHGKSYENLKNPGESYIVIPDEPLDGAVHEDTPTPDSNYRCIPCDEQIFPGYYSWWGLAVDTQFSPQWYESKYLPPYLKRPPESVYGGNVFRSSFSNLLQCYATSRACTVQDIHLKMGGTLRYKREIGHVVIICTSNDLDDLNIYNNITSQQPTTVFNPNDLVNDRGRVINEASVPEFTTHYLNPFVSYETLNFAFYFKEAGEFICDEGITETTIKHDSLCIRPTRLIPIYFDMSTNEFTTKRVCADHIFSPTDQDRMRKVIHYASLKGVEWNE